MDLKPSLNNRAIPLPLSGESTIVVVTGGRGVGKTTWCCQIVEEYLKAGFRVSGLLMPGRYENQKKNGIFAIDLASGESRLVASTVPGEINGFRFGAWMFDSKIFTWGNQRLQQSSQVGVLVIDELGFLEFDLSTGWKASFKVLQTVESHKIVSIEL